MRLIAANAAMIRSYLAPSRMSLCVAAVPAT
jgi:hypothetical protein